MHIVFRLTSLTLYFFSGWMPRNRRKIVFGAWMGQRFSDNPKYLLMYLAEHQPGCDFVWIGEQSIGATIPAEFPVRFVVRGSFAAYWSLLTAGTCLVTHGMGDVSKANLMRGARRIYLGHGLAIKNMGARDNPVGGRMLSAAIRLVRHVNSFDYYIASSESHREKLLVENAKCNAVSDQIIACGQPRVDFLINSDPQLIQVLREQLFREYGIPTSSKLISYLPTFRDSGMPAFSFGELRVEEREKLYSVLEKFDGVIVEKSHFAELSRATVDGEKEKDDRAFFLTGGASVDTQELLLMTDILITDYSGCYVDFLVLDRPVIHFAYDRDAYESADRGIYFDLDEVAGGAIAGDFESLCGAIERGFTSDPDGAAQREKARCALVEFENGDACRILTDVIFDEH